MLRLEDLFQYQDEALLSNRSTAKVGVLLGFTREFVGVVMDTLESLEFTDPAKQTVIRVLSVDATSSLVVACRAGLWGNVPEATILTRTALETLTILMCVVEEGAFRAFAFEMRARLRRFSYEACQTRLGGHAKKISSLHGQLSDVGGHTTRNRLKFAEFKLEGLAHDRLGFAFDAEGAEIALLLIPDSLQHLAAILRTAYTHEQRTYPVEARLTELNGRYAQFLRECDSEGNMSDRNDSESFEGKGNPELQ